MASTQPRFTVVVPTYNRPVSLARCLRSIAANEDAGEVIVVDDGSDPPANVSGPRVRLLRQAHQGPATARNLGASQARGKYLAFTDDDCVVAPDWLPALRATLEQRPESLIGGRVRNGEPHNWAAAFNQELLEVLRLITEGTPRLFLTSNNLCVSAAGFARMGGFDESFRTAAGEDREFCERWRRHGGEVVFEPTAVVAHHHPQGLSEFWSMHKKYGAAARHLERRRIQADARNIDKLRLYTMVWRRQPIKALVLSQLAALAGYLKASP